MYIIIGICWFLWIVGFIVFIFVLRAYIKRLRYRKHIKYLHDAEDWYQDKYVKDDKTVGDKDNSQST